MNRVAIGRKFARLATNAVVARPRLWRLFRGTMRRQFDTLAPHWDEIRSPGHLAVYERALDALPTPPARALDLGTGTGDGAVAIATRFPGAEVIGVDLAETMLEKARDKDYVVPGEYELYLFGHRRPELYGALVEETQTVEA